MLYVAIGADISGYCVAKTIISVKIISAGLRYFWTQCKIKFGDFQWIVVGHPCILNPFCSRAEITLNRPVGCTYMMKAIPVHRFVFGKWMNLFIDLLINAYWLL
jgi:hypothetical protein